MNKKEELHTFNIRMTQDLRTFLKIASANQKRPMGDIVIELIEKYKKKIENNLTSINTNV